MSKIEIPIHCKQNLTLEEAVAYSHIGRERLTALVHQPGCNFVLRVGAKHLIKRALFDKYIESISDL